VSETEKREDGVAIQFFFTVNILLLRGIELRAEVDLTFLSSVTTCRVTSIPAGTSLRESPVRFWAGSLAGLFGLFVAVFSSVCPSRY